MMTLKIGVFPGRVEEFAVENGTSVSEALDMAGIEVGAEQEVKADGTVIGIDETIPSSTKMLLVTKRIKGARL